MKRLSLSILAVVCVLGALASPASAATTTIGENPIGNTCGAGDVYMGTSAAYAVPEGTWYLRSFAFRTTAASDGQRIDLKLVRPTGVENEYRVIASTGVQTLAPGTGELVTFPVTTPVQAQPGDRVAIYTASFVNGCGGPDADGGYEFGAVPSNPPPGQTFLIQINRPTYPVSINSSAELIGDGDDDGVLDDVDAFPDDPAESADADADGVGDNGDNCRDEPNGDQADLDTDGEGDACDGDVDGDGVANGDDAFPRDPAETADGDGDGVGDNGDAFPDDPGESADGDGDGVGDNGDNCRDDANEEQADLDGDGEGDACDGDVDGDGAANGDDAFPFDPAEQSDRDGDGIGDNGDRFPDDPSESADADEDGVGDGADNCAAVANADQADQDADGEGDACDEDVDGDGVANGADNCREVPNADQTDADRDGIGAACDSPEATPSSLCRATKAAVESSPKYQQLPQRTRDVIDAKVELLCSSLDRIVADMRPTTKAVLIAGYKLGVGSLARDGWMTSAQAAELSELAGAL
jgi:hypothetical protein